MQSDSFQSIIFIDALTCKQHFNVRAAQEKLISVSSNSVRSFNQERRTVQVNCT